jgi:hypothetical protein
MRPEAANLRLIGGQHSSRHPRFYQNDLVPATRRAKETLTLRAIERRPRGTAKVVGMPRVGALHHRYHWQTAEPLFVCGVALDGVKIQNIKIRPHCGKSPC